MALQGHDKFSSALIIQAPIRSIAVSAISKRPPQTLSHHPQTIWAIRSAYFAA